MNQKPIKLNIGSGNRKIPGYINIDTRLEVEPDVKMDITNIYPTYKNIDTIYACHVLEHIKEWNLAIINWHNALKPGGILRIAVPDFEQVAKMYIADMYDLETLQGFLHGGQKNDYDIHYNTFDYGRLGGFLEDYGFVNVHRYNWRLTEHSHIDDYSQSYLPHMDKVHGKLMSLNIQAQKYNDEKKLLKKKKSENKKKKDSELVTSIKSKLTKEELKFLGIKL